MEDMGNGKEESGMQKRMGMGGGHKVSVGWSVIYCSNRAQRQLRTCNRSRLGRQ